MTHLQPHRLSLVPIPDDEPDGPEYENDTDSESTSPTSVVWTNDAAVQEIRDYLEDQLVDSANESTDANSTVLGTWFISENTMYLGLKLNISGYLRVGALYTKHFGYMYEAWTYEDVERPYDIMRVMCVCKDGFIEKQVIIKTIWIRLIQRHWKTRHLRNQSSLKGLMSAYKNSHIYIQ